VFAGFMANATAVAALYENKPIAYFYEALRYFIFIPIFIHKTQFIPHEFCFTLCSVMIGIFFISLYKSAKQKVQ